LPPPAYDYANIDIQTDGTTRYQSNKNDTTSPYVNTQSLERQNGMDVHEIQQPPVSTNDENYFVLEAEDNVYQSTVDIDEDCNVEDKANQYSNGSIIDDGDEEGNYNKLNESTKTDNSEYQNVKREWRARPGSLDDAEDYDHLKKPSERMEDNPNDDYDHCKSIIPKPHGHGHADRNDSVDEDYDRLQ